MTTATGAGSRVLIYGDFSQNYIVDRALPVSGLTAMLTLDTAKVVSGDAVLVVGATGGVGGFVTQLARARGARVIASVAASAADAARQLGASDVVDRDGDLAGQVKALVGPGVDVTIDVVGPRVWPAELAATRDGGRFVTTTPAAPAARAAHHRDQRRRAARPVHAGIAGPGMRPGPAGVPRGARCFAGPGDRRARRARARTGEWQDRRQRRRYGRGRYRLSRLDGQHSRPELRTRRKR